MICYRYVNDRLVQCPDHGHDFREVIDEPKDFAALDANVAHSRRERRARARRCSGPHRHKARRVRLGPSIANIAFREVAYSGHGIRDTRGNVYQLYLPHGQQVTDADCLAMKLATRDWMVAR